MLCSDTVTSVCPSSKKNGGFVSKLKDQRDPFGMAFSGGLVG